MKGLSALLLSVAMVLAATSAPARLGGVSGSPDPRVNEVLPGGDSANVALNLGNGFPLWYRDTNNRKLALCLDQEVSTAGGPIFPCLTAEPFPGAPISFPDNFGPEAFWWAATAAATFDSSQGGGDALLVLAQEAAFSSDVGAVDGDQAAFGRIRIRINVPVPGTYRITHPYGQVDYVVAAVGAGREINQTQDVGILAPLDFTASLENGPDQTPPPGFSPAVSAGIVAGSPVNIGPFLVPAGGEGAFVTATDGRRYLADPGFGALHLTQPVTGSPTGNNLFRIELLDPPDGFLLNAADGSQVVEVAEFQLMGKLFDDGPNLAPVAVADSAATAAGVPVTIDVLANDNDVMGAGNVHGINSQALGLPSGGRILRTEVLTTAGGAAVRRVTSIPTGKASFVYTPASGFAGVDTFTYVVQDTGGRISSPATVSVTVEKLTATGAEYRARIGKWRVEGTSSDRSANVVTAYSGPRGRLSGVPGVGGSVALKVSERAVDFTLRLDPLPASAVTAAHIHLGLPGESGPVLFFLHDSGADGPFGGTRNASLNAADLILRPASGINTFGDAVEALLSGNAHVDVHTEANPDGEIRAPLQLSAIGTATVDPATGRWSLPGKSRAVPHPSSGMVIESANGIRLLGTSPRMR